MMSRRVRVLADRLPIVVGVLSSGRKGPGPHWLMVAELWAFLARHEIEVMPYEFEAAIALAIESGQLMGQGAPTHSVAL